MAAKKPKYYDWEKTLSYDADVTMVIGARGIGKTFGLRMQCVRDYIKHGYRFVEVVRYKTELSDVADGYFDRLQELPEFQDWVFQADSHYMRIAPKPENDKEKPKGWKVLGYFVALTQQQGKKKKTFAKVRRVIFDESILERTDRYHHYLPNEFGTLANLISTISRERADTESIKPRLYLLGNAVDLGNPYFAAYRVESKITFGYHWYANKTFLLHYPDPGEFSQDQAKGTVAGRMLAMTEEGRASLGNQFTGVTEEFVKSKPKDADFSFGLVLNGKRFGIWLSSREGYYYVTRKVPKNTGKPVYSLTRDDATINYVAAKACSRSMGFVQEMYYYGILRYDDVSVKSDFAEVLQAFGVR